jgi:nitrate reductase gamma subunit
MRMITTVDDYLSLLVIIAPLVTGLMAFAHVGGPYQTVLAVHILCVELMFIWIPFGKIMHTFLWAPSRYNIGAFFQRKGVQA